MFSYLLYNLIPIIYFDYYSMFLHYLDYQSFLFIVWIFILKSFQPWEPQCFYPDFPYEIICGDSWSDTRLVLATESGVYVVEGNFFVLLTVLKLIVHIMSNQHRLF